MAGRLETSVFAVLVLASGCRINYDLLDDTDAGAGGSADAAGLAGNGGRTPAGGAAFNSGGASGTGGSTTGGLPNGGATTGGVPTGGVSAGGAQTGGVPTGGVSTGGVSTGGVSTGGSGGQAGGSGGSGGASSPGDCLTKTFNSAQYLFCADEVAWADARDRCASVGMHLVRIDDAVENQWVFDNVYDIGSVSPGIWIGASDLLVTGEWRWTDGTLFWLGASSGSPQGGLFNAWYPAQPTNSPHNACAMIDSNNGSTNWTTTGCASACVFVCEP